MATRTGKTVLPHAPEWQQRRVERRRALSAELYAKLNDERKVKRQRSDQQETDDDDDGVSSAQLHLQKQPRGTRNGGCGYWYGYVAQPRDAGSDESVELLANPHFDGWDPALVREWLQLQNRERGMPEDRDALAAFVDYFAYSITAVLESASDADPSRKDELLAALPLTMGPSLRRSRLVLGAVVPGTRGAGGSVQMLPCYTRNLRPLVFLRGVLRDILGRGIVPSEQRVGLQLTRADEALWRLGVTQAMRSPCLEAFENASDPTLAAGGARLHLLREWCVLGEQLLRSQTLLTADSKAARRDPEMYKRVEWLVHVPQLFETYVKLRLRERFEQLDGVRYTVTKPRARTRLPHFPDQTMYPDILVREATGEKALRAVYDAKLYRRGYRRHIAHMHQVEAYCAGLEAAAPAPAQPGQSGAAPDRTIQHAGLIYGYWAEEPPSERERRRKHRGCYFINLRGEASAVRRRFDAVLEEIVADFQARGADEGLGYISDDDDDDDDEEEDDDGSE